MSIESLSTNGSPTAEDLLAAIGGQRASGVLEISHPADEVSHVWFREGRIYAVHVPGYRPALGIRLLSGGLVTPDELSAAAAQQRERFPTHLIGHVLVGMGLVDQPVVEGFVLEQVLDQLADLLDLPIEESQFHPGRRIQQDVITPTEFGELLAVARQRRAHRARVLAAVGGPHAVPTLGSPGRGSVQTPLGPYDWALLCRVDGRRDITALARVCGFTVQESAQIVADLALTGLLVLPEPLEVPEEPLAPVVALRPEVEPDEPAEPQWHFDGTVAGEPEPVRDLLAEFSAFVHDGPEHSQTTGSQAPGSPESGEPGGATVLTATGDGPDAVGQWPPPVYDLESAAKEDGRADASRISTDSEPGPGAGPEPLPEPPGAPDTPGAAATVPEPAPGPDGILVGGLPETSGRSAPASSVFPNGAPVAPPADAALSDTSVFMRELSSLSDDHEPEAEVVTRMVVPLTEHPKAKKRRFWGF
jgi:hypothetical protein